MKHFNHFFDVHKVGCITRAIITLYIMFCQIKKQCQLNVQTGNRLHQSSERTMNYGWTLIRFDQQVEVSYGASSALVCRIWRHLSEEKHTQNDPFSGNKKGIFQVIIHKRKLTSECNIQFLPKDSLKCLTLQLQEV